jgi:Ca2+:H+ antiporter
MSGDEGDNEGSGGHVENTTKVRDFDPHAESSQCTERISSPERKRKKKKKKLRSKKHKKNSSIDKLETQTDPATGKEAAVIPGYNGQPPRHVGFIEDVQVAPEGTAAKLRVNPIFRPPLPKLLSQNVFVNPPPPELYSGMNLGRARSAPNMRRANSLPDLHGALATATALRRSPNMTYMGGAPIVPTEDGAHDEVDQPEMSRTAAVVLLLVATGLVALCAEFLVSAIPQMTEQSTISQAFIGLIILPIVGNAAEHVTAVTVAAKNKMDLAIGVAVGSSIQIGMLSEVCHICS